MMIEVMFGVASEAKFDIFNDRNERIFHALESNFSFSTSMEKMSSFHLKSFNILSTILLYDKTTIHSSNCRQFE